MSKASLYTNPASKNSGQTPPKPPQQPKPVPQPVAPSIDISSIPEGRVDQLFRSIPVLAKITPDQIRITINAANATDRVFRARLRDLNADIHTVNVNLENNIMKALKVAITNGLLIRNFPVDQAGSRDRLLEFSCNIDLTHIHPQLEGYAHLKVYCRLSATNGTLTLRNIERNFQIEVEHDYEEPADIDYDQQDYGDYDRD